MIPGHIEMVDWGKISNILANIVVFNLPATPKMDPQDRNTPVGFLMRKDMLSVQIASLAYIVVLLALQILKNSTKATKFAKKHK